MSVLPLWILAPARCRGSYRAGSALTSRRQAAQTALKGGARSTVAHPGAKGFEIGLATPAFPSTLGWVSADVIKLAQSVAPAILVLRGRRETLGDEAAAAGGTASRP
jgi:hypothetical protein